jgi:hypothetical protein
MGYDISNWKTKKLEGLTIPLTAFYKHERQDWHPKQTVVEMTGDGVAVILECGCEQEIKGVAKNGLLAVTEIEMSGEGSGTFFEWILKPALEESTGRLKAVLIWECGDSITRLKVKDGAVNREEIEL